MQVRQQICIIRTSGARLLALINDIMDAAALRHNKLVLKQETVVLRHVVEDVLDLTRSLVSPSVSCVVAACDGRSVSWNKCILPQHVVEDVLDLTRSLACIFCIICVLVRRPWSCTTPSLSRLTCLPECCIYVCAGAQAVELRNTVSPRITVLGDTGRIVQVLNNLLGNAGEPRSAECACLIADRISFIHTSRSRGYTQAGWALATLC